MIAAKCGVAEQWIGCVEATIVSHLKFWGEIGAFGEFETIINGHMVKNVRIEQAYKGNFHLLAE